MRDRISALRLAKIMSTQFQVWAGTANADEVIEDCCHALATALELTHEQRRKFMIQCRWSSDYQPKGITTTIAGWNTGCTPARAKEIVDRHSLESKSARHCVAALARISQDQPQDAIAMTLVAAVALARVTNVEWPQLLAGLEIAWKEEVSCTTP